MGGHSLVEISLKWLEGLSSGMICQVVWLEGSKGFYSMPFSCPQSLADKDGNWHVGAMATLIDNVGAATIFSSIGLVKASVELNISYYSTAKEEVETEAKVVANKEILTSVVVEVRKKDNGELIASGKEWMATPTLKVKLGEMSKL